MALGGAQTSTKASVKQHKPDFSEKKFKFLANYSDLSRKPVGSCLARGPSLHQVLYGADPCFFAYITIVTPVMLSICPSCWKTVWMSLGFTSRIGSCPPTDRPPYLMPETQDLRSLLHIMSSLRWCDELEGEGDSD